MGRGRKCENRTLPGVAQRGAHRQEGRCAGGVAAPCGCSLSAHGRPLQFPLQWACAMRVPSGTTPPRRPRGGWIGRHASWPGCAACEGLNSRLSCHSAVFGHLRCRFRALAVAPGPRHGAMALPRGPCMLPPTHGGGRALWAQQRRLRVNGRGGGRYDDVTGTGACRGQ